MAARLNPAHDQRTRDKIKTSQLINRLTSFALDGKDPKTKKPIEMSVAQVRAADILLSKTLPSLSSMEASISGQIINRVVNANPVTDEDWEKEYGNGLKPNGNGKTA